MQTTQAETGWDAVTDGSTRTTQPQNLAISYTYDALHRLKTASYDDGTAFSYAYDAAGNTLQAVKTIEVQAVTTVYSYDADNQLSTAQVGSGTAWQYHFDGNGSLVETTPGSQPGNEAKRYRYNSAGLLVQVEAHDGTSYRVQAEMVYNGQGQRLAMTAHQAGQSLSTAYLLDGETLLAATASGVTTYYLPGIGEQQAGWSYSLADGAGSVRQLSSSQGTVTLTRSFNPLGRAAPADGGGRFHLGLPGWGSRCGHRVDLCRPRAVGGIVSGCIPLTVTPTPTGTGSTTTPTPTGTPEPTGTSSGQTTGTAPPPTTNTSTPFDCPPTSFSPAGFRPIMTFGERSRWIALNLNSHRQATR